MNDLSYLFTEYARRKDQECYDIEYYSRLSAAPDTKTPDDDKSCMTLRGGKPPRTHEDDAA